MGLFKKKKLNEKEILETLQSGDYNKIFRELDMPKGHNFRVVKLNKIKGFSSKGDASDYYVTVDSNGNVIDLFHEDNFESKKEEYAALSENINIKEATELERKKTVAEEEMKHGLNREKNIKLLNAMKEEPEKIEDRYMNAEHRYLTAKQKLEELTADLDPLDPHYEKDFKELQSTAEYKRLANLEIQALKRFFKVSNALSGLSEELALTNPEYQAIDYNKRVQDIVTTQTPREKHQGENIFEYISSGGHTAKNIIPEDAPTSPMGYKKKVRDYVSQEDAEKELERTKPKSVLSGVVEGKREGESSEEYSKRMLETVSEQPKATGFSKFSTDELLKLLIEENQKKK